MTKYNIGLSTQNYGHHHRHSQRFHIFLARIGADGYERAKHLTTSGSTAAADKDNQRQLLVTGDGDQEDDQLYAWYRQITTTQKDTTTTSSTKYYKAGAIHLVSYEKIAIDLVLVSVNNSTAPNADYIKQVLDTIYNPAFVTWNINSLENGLTVELSDAAGTANSDNTWLDNTDADENMNFTYQEKLVRNAMKKLDSYDSDKYYLFFLNSGKDASMNGYMIFKNHFGFIFKNSQNPDVLARTIAHEIAHGAFRLRHTFSTGNKFVQTQGTTDNLMDYVSSGSALTARRLLKYQWDYVHNPETMWFTSTEDESEGELLNPSLVGEGIFFYPIAERRGITEMSNCAKGQDEIEIGKYTVVPHYWKNSAGNEKLVYYLAAKKEKDYRFDWVILPNSLNTFKNEETVDKKILNDSYSDFADNVYGLLKMYPTLADAILDVWNAQTEAELFNANLKLSILNLKRCWTDPQILLSSATLAILSYESYLKIISSAKNTDYITGLVEANKFIEKNQYIEGVKKIDLMGGKSTQIGGYFINIDQQAVKGIKGDVTKLSQFIKPNSIDEIVCSSPQAEFLSECGKVLKSGTKIYINGSAKNVFFNTIKEGNVESFGFEVISEMQPLNVRFTSMNFYFSDGIRQIPNDLMFTTILIKK